MSDNLRNEDDALDWVIDWAMAQDVNARNHYFHICDGGIYATCGCRYAEAATEGDDK